MLKDLTGQKFGRLTVIEKDENNPLSEKRTYWLCKCDCGNIKSVASQSLLRKKNPTRSCGCIRNENNQNKKGFFVPKIDMIGKRFGRLVVLEESSVRTGKNQKLQYLCQCDCGNKINVIGECLRNGITKSCGCLYKETRGDNQKKFCEYDLVSFSYGVGTTTNNVKFYFDKEDYGYIKDYAWYYDGYYIQAHTLLSDEYTTQIIRLHRLVMKLKDREDIQIDHINSDKTDCRKINLRRATIQQNNVNKKECYATTENPVGICFNNSIKRYTVHIQRKAFGQCDTFEEALALRKKLEEEKYGNFQYNPNADKIA